MKRLIALSLLFTILLVQPVGANDKMPAMILIHTPQATLDNIPEEHYYDSLELLACCIAAEAGNQSEYGQRLVCDVVLNRVDDADFPDNIWDVIEQPNQFSVVADNRINEVEPSEQVYRIVQEELKNRTNSEVIYFTSGNYGKYGTKAFKHGNHYFCGK